MPLLYPSYVDNVSSIASWYNFIDGTESGETLYGTSGWDIIDAKGGRDTVRAGDGNDSVHGGAGVDWLYGEAGDDSLHGGDDFDVLGGGEGNDALYGDGGADSLWGNDGNDRLMGGEGSDKLIGGRGMDTLTGGAGADQYFFLPDDTEYVFRWYRVIETFKTDTITDFDASGGDTIVLGDLLRQKTNFAGATAQEAIDQGYIYFLQHGNPGESGFGTTVYVDRDGGAHRSYFGGDFAIADLSGIAAKDLNAGHLFV